LLDFREAFRRGEGKGKEGKEGREWKRGNKGMEREGRG